MTTEGWWWLTLAIGLVVAIVVVVLLHTLYRAVRRIDENVLSVWMMGKQVARNTATTWLLGQTPRIAGEIKAEAVKHAELLGEVDQT